MIIGCKLATTECGAETFFQNQLVYYYKVDFRRLQESRPYDSTDPFAFKSSFFMGLDETTTCSAKRLSLHVVSTVS